MDQGLDTDISGRAVAHLQDVGLDVAKFCPGEIEIGSLRAPQDDVRSGGEGLEDHPARTCVGGHQGRVEQAGLVV